MTALGKVVRAGVGRRRVQTLVLTLTTLISVTASTLACGLLVASNSPFDQAFARSRGAHLSAQFDGAKVGVAQLLGTAHVPGVTAVAGPFPTTPDLQPVGGNDAGFLAGSQLPSLALVGRADPGGPVDDVAVVQGHWATGPGEIVLDASSYDVPQNVLGTHFVFPDLPGSPTLQVVGIAQSMTESAQGWTTPGEVAALTAGGGAAGGATTAYQMLYRFDPAATEAQVDADRVALATAVPAGAITGTQSYLTVRQSLVGNASVFVPFIAAFGLLGLAISVLIIGIVVSGAVVAGTRRIGVLKAIGFTPWQVARAYVGQAMIPATVGTVAGVLIAQVLAGPVLDGADQVYGMTPAAMPLWVDFAVGGGGLVLVAVVALVPALRAGHLRAAEAIVVGRTPGTGRGRSAGRVLGRLPLPRAVSLGLTSPFARPGRSAAMGAAVAFGAVAVTFAVGLGSTLSAYQLHRNPSRAAGAVSVETLDFGDGGPGGPGSGPVVVGPQGKSGAQRLSDPTPADPAVVAALIVRQPGTEAYFGISYASVEASGLSGLTTLAVFQGDPSWADYQMVSGTWFAGPGEAVAPSRYLQASGHRVGDTVTLTNRALGQGHTVSVRIVGEVLDTMDSGMDLMTGRGSVAGLGLDLRTVSFNVELKAGVAVHDYVESLRAVLPSGAGADANAGSGTSDVIATMNALIATLTLMLVAVAALGVLNTVLLDTRERVRDLGVYKAVGMTPRQTVAMVITSVAGIGLVAGGVGVPLGMVVHRVVAPEMAATVGLTLPPAEMAVYPGVLVVVLVLGGLAIAVAGALLPAGWAAKVRTATALRTE